jgi:serine/threonine protein phosphatase PrpC
MYENVVAVYKCAQDCYFYVLGNYDENELILLSALQCLTDAMSRLLRGQLDKRTLLENLDFLLLAIDELTDDGILLECDGIQLAQRVSMKSENDVPLSEQTVSQALRTARSKLEDVVLK